MGEGEKDQQEKKEQKQKPKKGERNNGSRAAKEPVGGKEPESGRVRPGGGERRADGARRRSTAHHGQGFARPRPTPLEGTEGEGAKRPRAPALFRLWCPQHARP